MPSLVRQAACDNASDGSVIGSSGRETYNGKEVEKAEDVEADESREPKKILRPVLPIQAGWANHGPLHFPMQRQQLLAHYGRGCLKNILC